MAIWCMGIACCIPKATTTHSVCVTVIVFQNNNCWTNAPEYYATSKLPQLLYSVLEGKRFA